MACLRGDTVPSAVSAVSSSGISSAASGAGAGGGPSDILDPIPLALQQDALSFFGPPGMFEPIRAPNPAPEVSVGGCSPQVRDVLWLQLRRLSRVIRR